MPMSDKYIVTKPGVLINKHRTGVSLSFDLMDPENFQGIGTGPQIRMTTLDAMRLLGLLQKIQEKYDLPQIVSEPEHIDMPPKDKTH